MITEPTNHEDQQGPEQDHDANESNARDNEHLWCSVDIWFNYILYSCQVMNNGALLPLLIQPARVAESPNDIVRLEPLPPRLQVESLCRDAALSVLLEGVHSGLPLLKALGAIGALHYI